MKIKKTIAAVLAAAITANLVCLSSSAATNALDENTWYVYETPHAYKSTCTVNVVAYGNGYYARMVETCGNCPTNYVTITASGLNQSITVPEKDWFLMPTLITGKTSVDFTVTLTRSGGDYATNQGTIRIAQDKN